MPSGLIARCAQVARGAAKQKPTTLAELRPRTGRLQGGACTRAHLQAVAKAAFSYAASYESGRSMAAAAVRLVRL